MKLSPWLILIGNCPPLVGIQTVFRGNTAAIKRTSLPDSWTLNFFGKRFNGKTVVVNEKFGKPFYGPCFGARAWDFSFSTTTKFGHDYWSKLEM